MDGEGGEDTVPRFIDLLEFYFNETVIVKIGTRWLCTAWQVICNSSRFIVPDLLKSQGCVPR